ncbi:PE-PPE domain-containing protein [Mycolicibacterium iranicum]|uniref:PE-PPE domain-containing protein n=1 Tax=Mycolicibacterium iranicum TaxID=912594 RepID=A0ABT4HIU3_MYCIR|nr:PE-PPE domain-containing protein [Mycolicibacterium iranicum]MCZ0730095.1 PE-PPE domain-containing protein [Mycolicibacterium iranicum]
MRHQARALVLVFVSLFTAMALAIASAFVSALAYGATALIVPGTGTPNADVVGGYRENAWSRYIDGVACTVDCSDPDLVGIPYPASFWPVSFIPNWCVPGRCDKWNVSVGEGTENLLAALAPFLDPASEEDVYIFGYSQGGAVVANALSELGLLDLPDEVKERLKVVTIGGIENPDGGLWQRLAWLQDFLGNPIPVLDVSFDPAMPVDTGIGVTSIGFEYDPVVYAPKYWGNIFSVLNMVAAFDTVHGYYLDPTEKDPDDSMPYGYTDATLAPQLNCDLSPSNCRTDSFGNSYIMIPATSLPLMDVVRALANSIGIGGLAKPFLDLAEPVLREIVDLGFDWTGNPGVSSPSSILPFKIFQNWVKVGIDFAVAAVKGVEAFIRNFIPEQAASKDADDTVVALGAPDEKLPSAAAEDAPVEDTPVELKVTSDEDTDAPADEEVVTTGEDSDVVVDEGEQQVITDEDTTETEVVVSDEDTTETDVVVDEEEAVTDTEAVTDEDDDSVAETADEDASESDTDTRNDTPAAA